MKAMIFHIPMKIDRERASASQIRPLRLIEAFKECGYIVDVVQGYGAERRKQIAKIKRSIREGMRYDFLYSESSTMPTLLTEKNHLPLYPFLDFSFFSFCKKYGIKIGLFYRDVYWCFRRGKRDCKQKVADYFYRYDLKKYERLVDVLFLPSKEMLKYIPFHFTNEVGELPPGLRLHDGVDVRYNKSECVNLLYVGGIGCHYDLKMIFSAVAEVPGIRFTVCCRRDEWEAVKGEYVPVLSERVEIVHESGKELEDLYCRADLFCLFMKPQEYRSFAVPFKLFEAIGYGCPVLASEGTWVSCFVKNDGIGFSCKYDMIELKRLLTEIVNGSDELLLCRERIRKVALENTWQARCREIASFFEKKSN